MTDERHVADLVSRTARGDTDALSALFGAYGRMVHGTALRLTASADDADDVVQDVFVGLPEALACYSDRGSFQAWLRVITARVALMRLRTARARDRAGEAAAPTSSLADEHDRQVNRMSLSAALERLPDDYRTVFLLKAVEGYSHEEIAELLGIRRGTSEVRLFRAIRQLRTILGRD